MDTLEHRIQRVQACEQALRSRQEKRRSAQLFLLCAVLLGGLIYVIGQQSALHRPIASDSAMASTLLESSAGGYVLVAVLAFTLGVLLAVLGRYLAGKRKKGDQITLNGGQNDEGT